MIVYNAVQTASTIDNIKSTFILGYIIPNILLQINHYLCEKMSKQKLRVHTDQSIIKNQLRKDEKFSQGVRLYAVYQIAKGRSAGELEELYNVSHKSVCNWVHRYNSEGLQGLTDRPRGGRPAPGGFRFTRKTRLYISNMDRCHADFIHRKNFWSKLSASADL
ncbi:hypothetical protein EZS27_027210 [termite gut metagenome]|uniref:DNA-binding domain-containing protein n=1 Tax=termite gut metagenome TaxID=433724 RepID=A0A5J4QR47_9ZZZZ